MSDKQKTLAQPVTLKGKGLHTGFEVEVTFNPAPANHGYKFRRIDLDGQPIIQAQVENVVDTSRGTTLEEKGVRIHTVEHSLAALRGLGIDNAMIDISGPELPILDGSSRMYAEAIMEGGIDEQDEDRNYYKIKEKVSYFDKENNIEITAYPDDGFSVEVLIDYNSEVLGHQYARFVEGKTDFVKDIAPCRTFVFFHELEFLQKNNLIKGGDLENAIVIMEREVSQEELDRMADLFNKPRVHVKPEGILNNLDLHFENEPARHKLLDMLGDLSLIGQPVKGRIIASRPGHYANTQFAGEVKQRIRKERTRVDVPRYNPNKAPLYNIEQIRQILPHRPPMLLVDKIIDMDETSVVGVKNVTMNESFFVGHFPDEPVMPGVLQIEAMAQAGGILVLGTVDNPEDYVTYFLKIDNARFKRKVVPGDTLIFRLELVQPIRRGIANMLGQAFVGDNIVMEAEMMAQIVKSN